MDLVIPYLLNAPVRSLSNTGDDIDDTLAIVFALHHQAELIGIITYRFSL